MHLPLVIGRGGEDNVRILDAALINLAAAERGTDERHIPTACLRASLQLAFCEFAFIGEDIL